MDAGTAAVLGALAGSVATIGAALATGWAQREGARISARAEHRRDRREPRQGIYKEFIAEASTMRDLAYVYSISLDTNPPTDDVNEETVRLWRRASMLIREKWVDVSLAGPKSIAEAASTIERTSYELTLIFEGYRRYLVGDPERSEVPRRAFRKKLLKSSREFDELLNDFVIRAQAALDDDGSRR